MTTEQTAAAGAAPLRRADGARPRRRRGGVLFFLRDVLVIVLIAVMVSFLVKTFLVRSFYIPSGSMENTLQVQDRILVDEITPRFGGYSRGDIVVFRDPGGWLPVTARPDRSPFAEGVDWVLSLVGLAAPDSDDHLIKRVIGMPGDHVVCCNDLGQLTINDVAVDEASYLKLPSGAPASAEAFDVTVPGGAVWVLGDNRNESRDARFHTEEPGRGFVPIDDLVGRAFLVTWPFDRFGPLDFHHEVFASVPPGTAQDDATEGGAPR